MTASNELLNFSGVATSRNSHDYTASWTRGGTSVAWTAFRSLNHSCTSTARPRLLRNVFVQLVCPFTQPPMNKFDLDKSEQPCGNLLSHWSRGKEICTNARRLCFLAVTCVFAGGNDALRGEMMHCGGHPMDLYITLLAGEKVNQARGGKVRAMMGFTVASSREIALCSTVCSAGWSSARRKWEVGPLKMWENGAYTCQKSCVHVGPYYFLTSGDPAAPEWSKWYALHNYGGKSAGSIPARCGTFWLFLNFLNPVMSSVRT